MYKGTVNTEEQGQKGIHLRAAAGLSKYFKGLCEPEDFFDLVTWGISFG